MTNWVIWWGWFPVVHWLSIPDDAPRYFTEKCGPMLLSQHSISSFCVVTNLSILSWSELIKLVEEGFWVEHTLTLLVGGSPF